MQTCEIVILRWIYNMLLRVVLVETVIHFQRLVKFIISFFKKDNEYILYKVWKILLLPKLFEVELN